MLGHALPVQHAEPPRSSAPTHGDKGKLCLLPALKYLAGPEHGKQLKTLLF